MNTGPTPQRKSLLALAVPALCALALTLVGVRIWMTSNPDHEIQGMEANSRDQQAKSPANTQALKPSSRLPLADASLAGIKNPSPWAEMGQRGVISGRVVDAGGNGLAQVLCTLTIGKPSWGPAPSPASYPGRTESRSAASRSAVDASASGARTTTTSPEGLFEIEAGPGPWQLQFEAPGYALLRADHLRAGEYQEFELTQAHQLTVLVTQSGGKLDGHPIAGVRVSLVDSFRDLAGTTPLDETKTDADGKAVLERAFPGEAYLRFLHPDYQYQLEIIRLPANTLWHSKEIQLSRGIAIGGQVTATETGGSIADAKLRVEAYGKGQSIQLNFSADARGRFESERSFSPGEFVQITAKADGFAESTRLFVVQSDLESSTCETNLDLSSRARRIVGRSIDSDLSALADTSVALYTTPPVQPGRDALLGALTQVSPHHERWRPATVSDSNGQFVIEGLSGNFGYVLMLTKEGYAPRFEWVDAEQDESETQLGNLKLDYSGSIYGQALFVEDASPIVGEDVRAQFEIILTDNDFGSEFDTWRPTAWWRPLEATVAADGSFRIDNVAPGSYDLSIGSQQLHSVLVEPGATVGPLQLGLPYAAVGGREHLDKLHGIITKIDGSPIEGAFVALFSADKSAAQSAEPAALTRSDLRGRFTLNAEASGLYRLDVTSLLGQYEDYSAPLGEWDADSRVAVQLKAVESKAEPAVGLVLDPYGEPIASATIKFNPPEDAYCGCLSFETQTDEDGVVILNQLGLKDYRVTAYDPLGRFEPASISPVRPGQYFELSFQF